MRFKATAIHAVNEPERVYKVVAATVYQFICLKNCFGGKLEYLLRLAYNYLKKAGRIKETLKRKREEKQWPKDR